MEGPNERVGMPQMRGWESPNWRAEDACSLTEETNMKYVSERNTIEKCRKWNAQMRGWESPNERVGEKQLYSRTQWTYARFVTEKVQVHVLTIPIMCPFLHFQ